MGVPLPAPPKRYAAASASLGSALVHASRPPGPACAEWSPHILCSGSGLDRRPPPSVAVATAEDGSGRPRPLCSLGGSRDPPKLRVRAAPACAKPLRRRQVALQRVYFVPLVGTMLQSCLLMQKQILQLEVILAVNCQPSTLNFL